VITPEAALMRSRQDGAWGERAPGRCRIRRLWQAGRIVPRVRHRWEIEQLDPG